MTHEYVIALNGRVDPAAGHTQTAAPTAVAWAADHVLAVGSDDAMRALSRGDSTFLDLDGCRVTALPTDLDAATEALRGAGPSADPGTLLRHARLLDSDARPETGSAADLAFWDGGRLVAVVRGGAFDEGDEHRGPFPSADAAP